MKISMKIVAKIMLVVMMMTINVEVDHNLIPIFLTSHHSVGKYQGFKDKVFGRHERIA